MFQSSYSTSRCLRSAWCWYWRIAVALSLLSLLSCETESYRSPDWQNTHRLLPDTASYGESDLGTMPLAQEMAGDADTWVSMVYYDRERRTPALYFTGGRDSIVLTPRPNGALRFELRGFRTRFMPLRLNVDITAQLREAGDTIFFEGGDGKVSTQDDLQRIGLPLPESDDAEISGFYLRTQRKLTAVVDLMLPMPMKSHWESTVLRHKQGLETDERSSVD